MNYLLEDVFRRADTWRGMGHYGMDAPGNGQQSRLFHIRKTMRPMAIHTPSPVSERVSMYWMRNCITEAGRLEDALKSSATNAAWTQWAFSCP